MAYDEDLADRVRAVLPPGEAVAEYAADCRPSRQPRAAVSAESLPGGVPGGDGSWLAAPFLL
jgi:hypothetical protein